jgi:four helix bundle protein
MASASKFEDLKVWQRARQLTRDVYRVSGTGAFAKDFGLRDQVRNAAVSIMSNIAEGFERDGRREFLLKPET